MEEERYMDDIFEDELHLNEESEDGGDDEEIIEPVIDPNFYERNMLNAEKMSLLSSLDASSSPIGDWKIARIYEARLRGLEDPYDLEDLSKQRDAARVRINEIDIELAKLDGVEPTEKQLLDIAKSKKQTDITDYDNSANVNSFIIGGQPMWLNFELRSRLKASLEAIEAAGGESMTKSFGGVNYTFTTTQWTMMINAVENYAGACQSVTESHRLAVDALETVDEVEEYDYTVGYPQKINFDEYFS